MISYNFDYDLFVKSITGIKTQQETTSSENVLTNVSKFSICVIVHGSTHSGKSTVAKILSK